MKAQVLTLVFAPSAKSKPEQANTQSKQEHHPGFGDFKRG